MYNTRHGGSFALDSSSFLQNLKKLSRTSFWGLILGKTGYWPLKSLHGGGVYIDPKRLMANDNTRLCCAPSPAKTFIQALWVCGRPCNGWRLWHLCTLSPNTHQGLPPVSVAPGGGEAVHWICAVVLRWLSVSITCKFFVFLFVCLFLIFLGPYLQHMEVPRLGVELEL